MPKAKAVPLIKNKPAELTDIAASYQLAPKKTLKLDSVDPVSAITIKDDAFELSLTLNGKVAVSGSASSAGLTIGGTRSTLTTSVKSVIESSGDGIRIADSALDARLFLGGKINAAGNGVVISTATSGTELVFRPKAEVTAAKTAILVGDLPDNQTFSILNGGTIKGAVAIDSSKVTLDLVNRGTIIGDIKGSDGSDSINLSTGTVQGKVMGGKGYDTYIIEKASSLDAIVELADGGYDKVMSTVTLSLGTAGTERMIEQVTLIGSAAIDATGNELSNNLYGNGNANKLDGGAGDDFIKGGDGNDAVIGGVGDDTLYGEAGDDQLDGGDGNDNLEGGDGKDTLQGGAGNDYLEGRAGDDVIDGGDGKDSLTLSSSAGVTVTISAGIYSAQGGTITSATTGTDTVKNVEYVYGSNNVDSITGSTDKDWIDGNGGDDTINGGDNDDTLYGWEGNDVINGDAGDDTISGGNDMDTIDGGANNDELLGNDGDDTLSGGAGDDKLFGGNGTDRLEGGAGKDELTGGSGYDTFVFTFADVSTLASTFEDTVFGFLSSIDKIRIEGANYSSATATTYAENTTTVDTLGNLILDANGVLNGQVQYYARQVTGGDTFLCVDLDGTGISQIIRLQGITVNDIAFSDITVNIPNIF